MKLSKNFSLDEFVICMGIVIDATPEQIFCLSVLCEKILQPIRDKFGSIKITSGLRNTISSELMIGKGYNASKTSDHLAWGIWNPRGTGAADFTCSNNMRDVFHWIQLNIINQIGQVIYYPDKNFIHVSNKFSNIFCMPDTRLETTRIMIYKNGKFIPYQLTK